MAKAQREMTIKFIPDMSAIQSALKGISKSEIKFVEKDKKEAIVAPIEKAIKQLNELSKKGGSGGDFVKAYQKIGQAASAAAQEINVLIEAQNKAFSSASNTKMLAELKKARGEQTRAEQDVANWEKKYGKQSLLTARQKADVSGSREARNAIKSYEAIMDMGKKLDEGMFERYNRLKEYVNLLEEKQAAPKKGDLELKVEQAKSRVKSLKEYTIEEGTNTKEVKELTVAWGNLNNIQRLTESGIKEVNNALSDQKREAKADSEELGKIADVFAGSFFGIQVGNLLQTAVSGAKEFFKEYDKIQTRSMMVTGMSREEVNKLTSSYSKLANQLSTTTKEVADAQLVFYQQGLATSEALKMTEASIAISKTGEISASEAANRLTAAIRGYKMSANEAMDLADKLSAVDAAAASSIDELTIAMQKSASQAKMAGLDLDYYIAYLSTIQEVTREAPENIGTAMKSITARLQEIKDIGKIEDDGTSFSNVAKALNSVGIAAVDSSGQLRSLQGIMDELGPKWASLDRNHKAYIATTLAGNRQQSRFIALMDNYDRALEIVNISQTASGNTAKQLRAYNQGLEASYTELRESLQKLATNAASTKMFTELISQATRLLELLNLIPSPILKLVTTLYILNSAIKAMSILVKSDLKGSLLKKLGMDKDSVKSAQTLAKVLGINTAAITSQIKQLNLYTIALNKNTKAKQLNANIPGRVSNVNAGAIGGLQNGFSLQKGIKEPKKLNITGGIVSYLLAQTAGSAVGLNESVTNTASSFVALGTTLGKFGLKGWIAAAAITALTAGFKALFPNVEEAKQNLEEYLKKQDELAKKKTDIESNFQVYKELSGKLNKTEEETSKLKDATEGLSELLPKTATRFNSLGEKVIDTASAYQELAKIQQEQEKISGKSLKEVDKIGRMGFFDYIAASFTGDAKKRTRRKREDANEEYYTEIMESMNIASTGYLNTIEKENRDLASKMAQGLSRAIYDEFKDTKESTDMVDYFRDEIKKLENGLISDIDNLQNSIKAKMNFKNLTYGEVEGMTEKIREQLERAGIAGESQKAIIDVILQLNFEGAANIQSVREQIEEEIKNATGSNKQNLESLYNDLATLNQEESRLLNNIGLLDTVFAEFIANRGGIKTILSAFTTQEGELKEQAATLSLINDLIAERNLLERGGITEEEEEKFNKITQAISSATSNIKSYTVPTFKELNESIKEIKTEWEELLSLAEKLDDSGGILDIDALSQMFDIFGRFEEQALSNPEMFAQWSSSIEKVVDGMSMENGQLKLTESSLSGINDLISYSTKLKIIDMKASLEKSINELQSQKDILTAQKTAVDNEIQKMEELGKKEWESSDKRSEMTQRFNDAYIQQVDATNENIVLAEERKLETMISANERFFSVLGAMREEYAKTGQVGEYHLGDVRRKYNNIFGDYKKQVSELFSNLIEPYDFEQTKENLTKLSENLGKQISNIDNRLNTEIKLKRTLTDYLNSADFNGAKFFGGASNSAKDYNEKLERTLSLLEKIEGLQHKIDENETFKGLYDTYEGEEYGRLLMTNLEIAKEQYSVYEDLFKMQQQMTNQAAGDLLDSPYGKMFKISKSGDIEWASAKMYDKYKGLPAQMKEDIDGLVEAFQKQRNALRSTEKDLSKYATKVKEVREQVVSLEIELENQLVEAIKNREKVIYNSRQKALSDEISMIEKAMNARKKARESRSEEKTLYKAQEALRRATLDSSGRNNAQLLQLQQDLEDKQLEMAEKRFEEDMDGRKQWLQDTKDADTEVYEYRLEKMTWYWDQVQIIQEAGTAEMMKTLITWNAEYNTQSKLQQDEMVRKWKSTMDALKEATERGANINSLTTELSNATHQVENMNIKVQKLAGTWKSATTEATKYQNAVGKGEVHGNTGQEKPDKKAKSAFNVGDEIAQYYDPTSGFTMKIKITAVDSYKDSYMYGTNVTNDPNIYWTEDMIKKIEKAGKTNVLNYYWLDKLVAGTLKKFNTDSFGGGGGGGRFASGGVVDYTGPAWVDGTKTKPEAFLNSYQTKQIAALAEALDRRKINGFASNSNITFGSINFNVASMSSAADGREALEVFVKGVNDMMSKRGIGTNLTLNQK